MLSLLRQAAGPWGANRRGVWGGAKAPPGGEGQSYQVGGFHQHGRQIYFVQRRIWLPYARLFREQLRW